MTMDLLEGETKMKDYGLERLVMLSDGVFAIAMTLLALELRPPAHWDRTIHSLILADWRPMLAYVMSFVIIGVYWASHRRTFSRFLRSDAWLTAFNLLLLGLVCLLPFASSLIAEGGPTGEPFTVYIALITAIGLTNAFMWGYAAFVGKLIPGDTPMSVRLVLFLVLLVVPTAGAMGGMLAVDGTRWWMGPIMLAVIGPIIWLRRRLHNQLGH